MNGGGEGEREGGDVTGGRGGTLSMSLSFSASSRPLACSPNRANHWMNSGQCSLISRTCPAQSPELIKLSSEAHPQPRATQQ